MVLRVPCPVALPVVAVPLALGPVALPVVVAPLAPDRVVQQGQVRRRAPPGRPRRFQASLRCQDRRGPRPP